MSFPCQRIVPLSGDNNPHSMRRKLVFPLPFSPTTASSVPGLTVTLISENSSRSPRLPLSATVWNIFREIPRELKNKDCRSVELLKVLLFANAFSIPSGVSYKTPVSESVFPPQSRRHHAAICGLMKRERTMDLQLSPIRHRQVKDGLRGYDMN